MNKKMKFWSIVFLTINSIIGTGIFLSPGGVTKQAGSMAPFIYLCAAVFAAVLAVTFAAASKYVVKNGAAYSYAKAAFGANTGMFIGVTRYVSASIAWGVMATGVVKNALSILGMDSKNLVNVTIGFLVLMLILFIINVKGTAFLTLISDLSTAGKVAALAITIVAGIVIIIMTGENHITDVDMLKNAEGGSLIPTMDATMFVTAVISAFYAFTGFESVASGASDMENPEKNLPRAIPLAIGIIAVIYFGIVLVAMMINPVALVQSDEVVILAAVFGNKIIRGIIIIGALISMFGINVASSFHAPRVCEAMAKDGILPAFLGKRNSKDIPMNAFILTAALAIVVPMSFMYDMQGIMIISSIARFAQFIIVPLGVIVFFMGKQKEEIIDAKKNVITDVVLPIISVALTVLLLYKFNWKGQFSVTGEDGVAHLNWYAITAMIIGYVILPIVAYFHLNSKKK
ncbi:putative ATP synthase F0, A subunit [Catonella morbi ATCC 51271]|uniref:Putative ATP synthase F0, A subunit n=1 Tax=Catonella morbi ATCC 51271 TaxID=592026 RepID=V2Z739_9FIRM|nr:APC family permease [Catonella morbi]ESL02735.1 putative ATP synthase F0, A subunit [Catonella morbi ATCC 51271]